MCVGERVSDVLTALWSYCTILCVRIQWWLWVFLYQVVTVSLFITNNILFQILLSNLVLFVLHIRQFYHKTVSHYSFILYTYSSHTHTHRARAGVYTICVFSRSVCYLLNLKASPSLPQLLLTEYRYVSFSWACHRTVLSFCRRITGDYVGTQMFWAGAAVKPVWKSPAHKHARSIHFSLPSETWATHWIVSTTR